MPRIVPPVLLVLLLSASATQAHNTLPADWCPVGSSPVIVEQFSFTAEQLRAYKAAQMASATCIDKTCGIIDDWFWANEMAMNQCGGYAKRSRLPEDAEAFVQSPSGFNAANHHQAYTFKSGPLTGQCVVCRADVKPVGSNDADY